MADAAYGFSQIGCEVTFVTGEGTWRRARRLFGRRPLRRLHGLARALDKAAVRRGIPGDVDLIYAMPGCQPSRHTAWLVLHQATHHPLDVRQAVAAARAEGGGGRGFLGPVEKRRLLRELEQAHVVRVESEGVAQGLLSHGIGADRVVIARPGVDLQRFSPGSDGRSTPVTFVGAFGLWKGVHHLRQLCEQLPRYGLTIIGGPVDGWSRRLMASLPIKRATDVPGTLAESRVLVLPSATDGFGYVVLEAMASGAVPVVTPSVGASEVVAELCPDLVVSGERLTGTVLRLLRHEHLKALQSGSRAVAEKYDHRTCAIAAARAVLDRLGERLPDAP